MRRLISRKELLLGTMARELKGICGSAAVVLVVLGGVVGYGVLYNLLYAPNVVREVAVAVVDESFDESSRKWTRMLDATPQAKVYVSADNIQYANELLSGGKVEAVVKIPRDFDRKIVRGEQPTVEVVASTASLLCYEAVAEATAAVMLEMNAQKGAEMVAQLPVEVASKISQTATIQPLGTALFNTSRGYAQYLLPAVLVVIICQTLTMAVVMRMGADKRSGRVAFYGSRGVGLGSMCIVIGAKVMVYMAIYSVLIIFLFGLVPKVFGLPQLANAQEFGWVLVPTLISTILIALTISRFFEDSDSPLLVITFFSVGLILLAGISYPLGKMPLLWQIMHYALPAPTTISAYVSVNCMDAVAADVGIELRVLWAQCLCYLLTAALAMRHNVTNKGRKKGKSLVD